MEHMHVRTENWEEVVSVENDRLVRTALPWGDWKVTGPEANYLNLSLLWGTQKNHSFPTSVRMNVL